MTTKQDKLSKRPVHLNLFAIRFPIMAIVSICHRVSGVLLFLMIPLLLWVFQVALQSPEGYTQVAAVMGSFFIRLLAYLSLLALIYHLLAGCRHLLMDMHVGDTLEGGKRGSWVVIGLFVVIAGYLALRILL